MNPSEIIYVAVNTQVRPNAPEGLSPGAVTPFITREVNGEEFPVHARASDGGSLAMLAGFGMLVPAPAGLRTVPFR
jgi:hypothetical protein